MIQSLTICADKRVELGAVQKSRCVALWHTRTVTEKQTQHERTFSVVAPQAWDAIHGKPPSKDGITMFPVLLHPRSRGTIRLRSVNPEDPALINPNYMSEDADAKILVEGQFHVASNQSPGSLWYTIRSLRFCDYLPVS